MFVEVIGDIYNIEAKAVTHMLNLGLIEEVAPIPVKISRYHQMGKRYVRLVIDVSHM